MKGNRIYRTRRDRNGKFDSMTVNQDTKQVCVRHNDSFINRVTVVSMENFKSLEEQFRNEGYEIINLD